MGGGKNGPQRCLDLYKSLPTKPVFGAFVPRAFHQIRVLCKYAVIATAGDRVGQLDGSAVWGTPTAADRPIEGAGYGYAGAVEMHTGMPR
jgi:hypothetical protein